MGDLTDPRAIYAKGALFFVLGCLAGGLLLADNFQWRTLLLLSVCIWAFCRFYYFVFYVIEHYVDSHYRFAGLYDFFRRYCWQRRTDDVRAELKRDP